jgi:hypothetical protein
LEPLTVSPKSHGNASSVRGSSLCLAAARRVAQLLYRGARAPRREAARAAPPKALRCDARASLMHMRHSFMMRMRSVAPVAMTGAVGHAVRAYASHHHRLHAPRTCTAHRTAAAAVVCFVLLFPSQR